METVDTIEYKATVKEIKHKSLPMEHYNFL